VDDGEDDRMVPSSTYHYRALLYLAVALASFDSIQDAWPAGYKVIYNFVGGTKDGAHPAADLRLREGNLYGTTTNGAGDGLLGPGTVFKLALNGTETVLHKFNYSD